MRLTQPSPNPATQVEPQPASACVARQAMNFDAYLRWNPEGGLVEWVRGEAVQYMSTTAEHQRIVTFLVALLQAFCDLFNLGRVFSGPYTMRAQPDGNGREPDVFVVLTPHLERARSEYLDGPADLVVEVISDDSVARDRVDKFDEYEAAGISEYWIIDPRPGRRRASFFMLDAQRRFQPVQLDAGDTYHSTVLPGLWLMSDWLWQDNPSVMQALIEIVSPEKLIDLIRGKSAP